jgi:hypothetical protein
VQIVDELFEVAEEDESDDDEFVLALRAEASPITIKSRYDDEDDNDMGGVVSVRTRCFHVVVEETLPEEAKQLISEFDVVFRDKLPLKPARLPPFEIQLIPGEVLKRHRFVRPQGQHMQEEIRREVQKLIEAKCVIRGEASACSQVLLVKKPDESWRFCIDYRSLNSVTIPDSFPLPKIEDVMQKLEGKALYTVFDLLKGYYQIALHPNSQHLSAFITPDGVYKWVRIPMGVMNAPSYFQMKLRTEVLAGLEDSCIVYIDDVIIFGQTKKEHWTNVRKVLERFRQFNIVVSPKKCRWGLLQLQYLGILINSEGQWMSDERKRAFNDIPLPTTMTQLRSFLGAGNYFRKHIEKYAAITASLYQIVSKGKKTLVMWEPHTIEAFETLKIFVRCTGSAIQQQDLGFGIVAKSFGPNFKFFAKTFNLNKFHIARLDAGILLGKISLCINNILTALLARKK